MSIKIKSYKLGFTLTEIMLVVIIIGVIAGFALPNYNRSLERAYARDAIIQLTALHASNMIYKAHNGTVLQGTKTLTGTGGINDSFDINIIPSTSDLTYSYASSSNTAYAAYARYQRGSTDYSIKVTQADLQTTSPANPCCTSQGSCSTCCAKLTVPGC